jgi:hypothetical protein
MPQLQTIVLADRETAPVNHTFVPAMISQPNNVGVVVETTGVPVGEPQLTVSMRKVNGKLRGRLTLSVPQVQSSTVNGVTNPVVVRTAIADLSVTYAETSTLQERANLVGMLYSALATNKTLVNDALVKGEGVY